MVGFSQACLTVAMEMPKSRHSLPCSLDGRSLSEVELNSAGRRSRLPEPSASSWYWRYPTLLLVESPSTN